MRATPGISCNASSTSTTANGTANISIQIPTGSFGLFVLAQNPQSQYLIETNPEFTIYNNFISSDYMMQQINFSPDITMKRLGDAFYENKLIQESIFAQTGRHFLSSDLTSDYEQYQYLMDSALEVEDALQLIPGVALTYEQVAALNRDIVWLEEQVIAGGSNGLILFNISIVQVGDIA